VLVGDRPAAFDFVQPSSRTGDWRYTERPCMGATGLLRVSRDPARTGPLAERPVTDVLRTCDHSLNDGRCVDGRANNAACGDADVHAYGHAKRRYNCLHPQPALARRRRLISPDRAGATAVHCLMKALVVIVIGALVLMANQANAQRQTTARTRRPIMRSQNDQMLWVRCDAPTATTML
jgi:hypothetical protein